MKLTWLSRSTCLAWLSRSTVSVGGFVAGRSTSRWNWRNGLGMVYLMLLKRTWHSRNRMHKMTWKISSTRSSVMEWPVSVGKWETKPWDKTVKNGRHKDRDEEHTSLCGCDSVLVFAAWNTARKPPSRVCVITTSESTRFWWRRVRLGRLFMWKIVA